MHPFLLLGLGMGAVLGGILLLRLNAFLALIGAALLVSLLAPGEAVVKVTRVAEAFGRTAGNIGIVIALAAIIGRAMMESGAAARVVQLFLHALGERRAATALGASGFLLAIPVFFDTVFFLLVPLARSMFVTTGRNYLRYLLAVCAGGVATHALVPPTPGPLLVASTLGVDLGTMVLVGAVIGIPAATAGLAFAAWLDRRMPVPLRAEAAAVAPTELEQPTALPPLLPSLMPIVLPVALISMNTVVTSLAAAGGPGSSWEPLVPAAALVGNANVALLAATVIALLVYARQRRPGSETTPALVEASLMSGGLIILITAAGGAFGAMLQEARIGPEIQALFGAGASGYMILGLAFGLSSLMKVAQGSSTVAMITASAMLAAMIGDGAALPFHVVYVATAIGAGALVGSWMNDSGFWVVSRMGGLTEAETLKSWTPLLALVGSTAMVTTVVLAVLLPLR
jgi:gluconate:H+ symporter, GntP family